MVSTRGIKLETPTGRRPRKSNVTPTPTTSAAVGSSSNSESKNKAPVKVGSSTRKSGRERGMPVKFRDPVPAENVKPQSEKPAAGTVAVRKRKAAPNDTPSGAEIVPEAEDQRKPKRIRITLKPKGEQSYTPKIKADAVPSSVKEVCVKISLDSKVQTKTASAVLQFPLLSCKTANGKSDNKMSAKNTLVEVEPDNKKDLKVAIRVDGKVEKKTYVASLPATKSGGDSVQVSIRVDDKASEKTCVASIPTAATGGGGNNSTTEVKVFIRTDSKLSEKTAIAKLPTSVNNDADTPTKSQPTGQTDLASPDADALLIALTNATGGAKPNKSKKRKSPNKQNSPKGKSSILCKYDGCTRYRQGYTGGYCNHHMQFGTGTNKPPTFVLPPVQDDVTKPNVNESKDGILPPVIEPEANDNYMPPVIVTDAKPSDPPSDPLHAEGDSPTNDKTPPESKQCLAEGCTRYKRSRNGGYCLTHKHLWDGVEEIVIKIAPLKQQCRVEGCVRYKRSNNGGYCLSHKHLFTSTEPPVKCTANKQSHGGMTCLPALPGTRTGGHSSLPHIDNLDHEISSLPNFDGLLDEEHFLSGEKDAASALTFLGRELDNIAPSTIHTAAFDADTSTNEFLKHDLECDAPKFPSSELFNEKETKSSECEQVSNELKLKDPPEYLLKTPQSNMTLDQGDYTRTPDAVADSAIGEDSTKTNEPNEEPTSDYAGKKKATDIDTSVEYDTAIIDEETAAGRDRETAADNNAGTAVNKNPLPQAKSKSSPTLPPDIELKPPSQRKDRKKRSLCKVLGCTKLDQSGNKGFCRSHFNLIYAGLDQDENPIESWTCICGLEVGGMQKRCSGCFRWKGGKREPYNVGPKRDRTERDKTEIDEFERERTERRAVKNDTGTEFLKEYWTCSECGKEVEEQKSRCGACHHWRGGKRKGGWKLGEKKDAGFEYEEFHNVDCSVDWNCKQCMNVNKGEKKRCSKCCVWRFPRNKARLSSSSVASDEDEVNGNATDDGGHWICKTCSYDNFATEVTCLICKKKRPKRKTQSKFLSSGTAATNQPPTGSKIVYDENGVDSNGVSAAPVLMGGINADQNPPNAAIDSASSINDVHLPDNFSEGNVFSQSSSDIHFHNYLQDSPRAGHGSFDYSSSYLHTGFLNTEIPPDYMAGNKIDESAAECEAAKSDESEISESIVQI